jgi:hypothetical protein
MSDKLPFKSKKFLAYLIADLGWKILIFYFIFTHAKSIKTYEFGIILTLVIVSGFIQVGYILGQAALDKYTYISTTIINDQKNQIKKD